MNNSQNLPASDQPLQKMQQLAPAPTSKHLECAREILGLYPLEAKLWLKNASAIVARHFPPAPPNLKRLWDHMHETHGLRLLESELNDIHHACDAENRKVIREQANQIAALSAPSAPDELARREATRLAETIYKQEYALEAWHWKPLDTVAGIISQIDNMYTGVRNERDELRTEVAKLKAALELGQENCDAVYEDLRGERDGALELLDTVARGFERSLSRVLVNDQIGAERELKLAISLIDNPHKHTGQSMAKLRTELARLTTELAAQKINADFWLAHEKNQNVEFEKDYLAIWQAVKQPDMTVLDSVLALKQEVARLTTEREQWRMSSVCRDKQAEIDRLKGALTEIEFEAEHVSVPLRTNGTTTTVILGRLANIKAKARAALAPAPTTKPAREEKL